MAQTDRQTDKAIHWKTAVFDVDDSWQRLETLPDYVKEVHRQKEVCPTTQRDHWQIHVVCHRQVRFASLKAWIPKTHWIPVFGKQHIQNSIAYCSKKESAVEGTQRVDVGQTFYKISEILQMIASRAWYEMLPWEYLVEISPRKFEERYEAQFKFKNCAGYLVGDDLTWVDRISNPVVAKLWNDFGIKFLREAEELGGGSFIIEDPPVPLGPEFDTCLISDS